MEEKWFNLPYCDVTIRVNFFLTIKTKQSSFNCLIPSSIFKDINLSSVLPGAFGNLVTIVLEV